MVLVYFVIIYITTYTVYIIRFFKNSFSSAILTKQDRKGGKGPVRNPRL